MDSVSRAAACNAPIISTPLIPLAQPNHPVSFILYPNSKQAKKNMSSGWAEYLARGVPPQKRYLIGGNWKANGTVSAATGIVKFLNEGGAFPREAEVVISPPAHLLGLVKSTVRKDVGACLRDSGVLDWASGSPGSLTYTQPNTTLLLQRWPPRTRR